MARRIRSRTPPAVPLLLLVAGCTSSTGVNYRQQYRNLDAGDAKSESLTELVEISHQEKISPQLEYRFSERLLRTDSKTENFGITRRDTQVFNAPSLDVILAAGAWKWIQGYEFQTLDTSPSDFEDNHVRRHDILQKVEWEPLNLPKITGWFDVRKEEDDLFLDRDDHETVFQVEESRGPFDYFYSFENERLEDHAADSKRDRTEHNGRLTYRDTFLDNRLSATTSFFYENRRTTDRADLAGSALANEVTPAAGLFVIDASPAVAVLDPLPSLIDGDETTSTGINIGGVLSGGDTDRNIGVEVALGSMIDQVLLSTVDEVDFFFLDQFSFSVWVSDDNNFWDRVTPSASFIYEPVFRRFRLSFPEVNARFLKVVNSSSPPAAPAVLVSEIRVFGRIPGALPNESKRRRSDTTFSVTSNFSWRAQDNLTFNYDLFASRIRNHSDGNLTRDEDRFDQGITTLWAATDKVDVNLRTSQQRINDPKTVDELTNIYSGLIEYRPIETLDLTLGSTLISRNRDHDRDLDTTSVQTAAAAALLETLDAEVGYEYNVQEDFGNGRNIRRNIISAALFAELTPRWDFTLELRDVQADVTGFGANVIPSPTEREIQGILLYRPSSQLLAEINLEWNDNFSGDGLDQQYRIDWVPFPDGKVDLQLDARRQTSGLENTKIDSLQSLARYTFNPKAFLEFNHTYQVPDEGDRVSSLALILNMRF